MGLDAILGANGPAEAPCLPMTACGRIRPQGGEQGQIQKSKAKPELRLRLLPLNLNLNLNLISSPGYPAGEEGAGNA